MGTMISVMFASPDVLREAFVLIERHTIDTEIYHEDCIITARTNRNISESDVRRWLPLFRQDIIGISVSPCDNISTEDMQNEFGFTNAEEYINHTMRRYQ